MIGEMKFVATALVCSGPMFILWGGEEYGLGLIIMGALILGCVRMTEWVASALDQESK